MNLSPYFFLPTKNIHGSFDLVFPPFWPSHGVAGPLRDEASVRRAAADVARMFGTDPPPHGHLGCLFRLKEGKIFIPPPVLSDTPVRL